jgi:DNA-directed RNA polymerase specialized sigma subunit
MNLKTATERELLKQHSPLVASAVQQFTQTCPAVFSAEHLHGLGLIALLNATRHYQPANHVSFETFARVQIHSTLLGETRRAKTWFSGTDAAETSTPAYV